MFKSLIGWIVSLVGLCLIFWVIGGNIKTSKPPKYIFTDNNWAQTTKRILKDAGVEDVEGCLRWAFGDGYKLLEIRQLDDKWRQRHGDIFMVEGSDCIIESTKVIATEWLKIDTKD